MFFPLTIFTKSCISDVSECYEYAYDYGHQSFSKQSFSFGRVNNLHIQFEDNEAKKNVSAIFLQKDTGSHVQKKLVHFYFSSISQKTFKSKKIRQAF